MNTYQYQVLRYMPDRVSGEFVNLGIVIYEPKSKIIKSKFYQKITRVSSFFPSLNNRYLASSLKFLQKEFDAIEERCRSEFNFEKISSIAEITKKVLPKDDSSLYFTDQKNVLELNEDVSIKELYNRFVLAYIEDDERDYINDKEVWNRIYKSYFETLGVSKHLKMHTVKTQFDTWDFDKAWKNGVWNCFETVSFDLLKSDSIKDKVYKWSGMINELQTSKEAIHVYLLSKFPQEHSELKTFIKKKLGKIKFQNDVVVELIEEENAEKFAKKIKKEIDDHI